MTVVRTRWGCWGGDIYTFFYIGKRLQFSLPCPLLKCFCKLECRLLIKISTRLHIYTKSKSLNDSRRKWLGLFQYDPFWTVIDLWNLIRWSLRLAGLLHQRIYIVCAKEKYQENTGVGDKFKVIIIYAWAVWVGI